MDCQECDPCDPHCSSSVDLSDFTSMEDLNPSVPSQPVAKFITRKGLCSPKALFCVTHVTRQCLLQHRFCCSEVRPGDARHFRHYHLFAQTVLIIGTCRVDLPPRLVRTVAYLLDLELLNHSVRRPDIQPLNSHSFTPVPPSCRIDQIHLSN